MLPYRIFLSCAFASSLVFTSQAIASDCVDPGLASRLSTSNLSNYTIVQGDLRIGSQYKIPQTRFGHFIWHNFRRERVRLHTWRGQLTGQIMSSDGKMQSFDEVISFNLFCDEHGTCDGALQVRRQHRANRLMFLQVSESGGFELNMSTCGSDEFEASEENLSHVQQCLDAGGC